MIDLESIFSSLLQRDLIFSIDGKSIKRGKLILYSIKDFTITFFLQCGDEQKRYELPYPFAVTREKTEISLDYRLQTLAHNNDTVLIKMRSLNKKKNIKIYDSIVNISESITF